MTWVWLCLVGGAKRQRKLYLTNLYNDDTVLFNILIELLDEVVNLVVGRGKVKRIEVE